MALAPPASPHAGSRAPPRERPASRWLLDVLRWGALSLVAAFLVACATSGARSPLSNTSLPGLRTWSWHEHAPRLLVPREEARQLRVLLSESLERGLRERGYVFVESGGDFTVDAMLSVLLRIERSYEPMAARAIWSHHASPSYWVEGSRPVEKKIRELSLNLVFRGRDGQQVSTVVERRLVRPEKPLPVADLVASILAPLERRGQTASVGRAGPSRPE